MNVAELTANFKQYMEAPAVVQSKVRMTIKTAALRRPTAALMAVVLAFASVFTFSGKALAFTGSGAGTVGNPFQITTCVQLQEMNDDLDAHYILMNDIDCSATSGWNGGDGFAPIGDDSNVPTSVFTGTLDGQNHVITGLFIDRSISGVGLFGLVSAPGEISNVGLTGVDITGDNAVGGLVGFSDGTIENSYATGNVNTDDDDGGGLVGVNEGTIQDSYAGVEMAGDGGGKGGLVGVNAGTIESSYASGNVLGGYGLGGLVSENFGDITDSYATGNVSGEAFIGGLVGANDGGGGGGSIVRSYSIGSITGNSDLGGLVGSNDSGTATNSFWNTETSGQATSPLGTGKTTAEMKAITTFQAATWDVDFDTTNLNNGYPFLSWQAGDSSPVWYIYQAASGSNTTTFADPLTGKQVTLEVDPSCNIQAASVTAESSNTVPDLGFDYPVGLINFTADCGTPGYTTTVTQYYYGLTNDNFVLRKHNPNTNAYFQVAGYTLEQTTHNSQAALKVTYQATDGGNLDTDGTANGTLVDPVGLARSAVGAPNTGLGGRP